MARRPQQSYENYFGEHGAILRDYRQWNEYTDEIDPITNQPKIDPATGKVKQVKTGVQLGMSVDTVSPLLGFAHVTVKIAGDSGTLDYPDLDDSFDNGDYVYVAFDNFVGGSYSRDGVTYYTGKASRVYLANKPIGKSRK